jgi:hypothetical protein
MNGFSMIRGHCIYLEIGARWLKALDGQEGFEFALERQANGRLTQSCKQKLTAALQQFVKRKGWQARPRAVCAIGANGVSLRRLSVPAAARDQFQRLLLLQIENEFPLPPAELAWGCQPLGQTRNNGSVQQDLLVIAVRKEVLQDYAEVLDTCGLSPAFTLAALARSRLCRQPLGTCAVLDLAPGNAEAILFEKGVAASIRASTHDGDDTAAVAQMADFLSNSGLLATEGKLFVSGNLSPGRELLEKRFSQVTVLEAPASAGSSAAILGLKKMVEQERSALLCFESKPAHAGGRLEPGVVRKWAVTAAALALVLLLLPGMQAIVLKPWLARKLNAIKADSGKLTAIDQELGFFEFLKQNQPPYLDALFVCAKSAPQGARFDSLSMNRRGEIQMRGSMRNADQVSEFRSKLIDSGFFSSVSVEDQSPTPDRQKVNVRIAAQWRPYLERAPLALGPSESELSKDKAKAKN